MIIEANKEILKPWSSPLFRWAGSKRKLLPSLIECSPRRFIRYIEPFAGSACLFFALKPQQAVLGDINQELLKTYEVIRSHPRLVARAAHSFKNSVEEYYKLRRVSPHKLDPIERAARFVYLNRYCFNGVYRTNKKGEFNVPRGVRTGNLPDEKLFYRCSVALRAATIRPLDFRACLHDVRKGDFIYLDPPYATSTQRRSGEYGYGSFDSDDLESLVDCLKSIDRKGARFLLSYKDSTTLKRLLPVTWQMRKINVKRHVAGFAKYRTDVIEVLISN